MQENVHKGGVKTQRLALNGLVAVQSSSVVKEEIHHRDATSAFLRRSLGAFIVSGTESQKR